MNKLTYPENALYRVLEDGRVHSVEELAARLQTSTPHVRALVSAVRAKTSGLRQVSSVGYQLVADEAAVVARPSAPRTAAFVELSSSQRASAARRSWAPR